MRGILLSFGAAFLGFDLYAQVFDSVTAAREHFFDKYGIEYDRYVEIYQKLVDETSLTDEEQAFVENTEDLFWIEEAYSEEIDTSGTPVQQVGIFEVGDTPTMVIGQGMF